MAFFKERELGKLTDLTSKEFVQRWQGIEKKLSSKDTITIANTGLVNSGKSSLFNALLDAFEEERFPVGAIRTTKQGDKESLLDGVDIMDTPGIDATDEDDDVAYRTLMEADLIVATHNIKMGMLNKSEYEWLSHLAKKIEKKEIIRRLIFVCTWIDERQRQEDYQSAIEETKRQVFEAVGVEIPFWEVSAKRYFTAHQKGNEALAQASKIPQFKGFLLERASEARKIVAEQRKKELHALCSETMQILRLDRAKLQVDIDKKRRAIQKQYAPVYQNWKKILENFSYKRKLVEEKLNELKSENTDSSLHGFINKIHEM